MRKDLLLILIILPIIFFNTACRSKKTADTAAVELRYGFTSEPSTLDPLSSSNTADGRSILFNIFEGLVKPDTEGNFLPCMAESWNIEQDGLVYNFKIRRGVHFHDNSIMSSADVKFSLETAMAFKFTGLERIKEIIITDDDYISVILKSPDPEFLPFMTVGIVKAGNDNREKNVIGTGPFYLESYTIQTNLIMKKFDNYWQRRLDSPVDLPCLEKVTIVFLADTDALLLALRGGSIDGASITGSMITQLDPEKFDAFNSYSASVQLLAINNSSPPYDDIRVRRAINYGIDIKGIIDAAFFGFGMQSSSPVIPGLFVHYDNSLNSIYPVNQNLARSLLEDAGYGDGLKKLTMEITVPSNYTMHVDTAQVIADQLSKIGVNVTIKLVDWAQWLSEVYFGRNYQTTIISLDSPSLSARSFLARYHSKSGSNFINFNSPDFDKLYDASLSELNDEKRIDLYKKAQRDIVQNAASVYIQDIYYFKVFRGGAFGGVLNYPLYVIDFASIYGTTAANGIEKKN